MSLGVEYSQCLRRFGRARSADRWDVTVFKFLMPTLTTEGKHWMRQGLGQEGFEKQKIQQPLDVGHRDVGSAGLPDRMAEPPQGPGLHRLLLWRLGWKRDDDAGDPCSDIWCVHEHAGAEDRG